MDAEECIRAQHFHVPVLDVEGVMLSYRRGVDKKLFVRSIRCRGVDGKFVVGSIGGGEVGQGGDADGW